MVQFGRLIVIKKDGVTDGSSFPIITRQIIIGRDSECDIRLSRPKVAPKQCRLEFMEDGNVIVENIDPENLLITVENQEILKSNLYNKQIIQIDTRLLRFEQTEEQKKLQIKNIATRKSVKEKRQVNNSFKKDRNMSLVMETKIVDRNPCTPKKTTQSRPKRKRKLSDSLCDVSKKRCKRKSLLLRKRKDDTLNDADDSDLTVENQYEEKTSSKENSPSILDSKLSLTIESLQEPKLKQKRSLNPSNSNNITESVSKKNKTLPNFDLPVNTMLKRFTRSNQLGSKLNKTDPTLVNKLKSDQVLDSIIEKNKRIKSQSPMKQVAPLILSNTGSIRKLRSRTVSLSNTPAHIKKGRKNSTLSAIEQNEKMNDYLEDTNLRRTPSLSILDQKTNTTPRSSFRKTETIPETPIAFNMVGNFTSTPKVLTFATNLRPRQNQPSDKSAALAEVVSENEEETPKSHVEIEFQPLKLQHSTARKSNNRKTLNLSNNSTSMVKQLFKGDSLINVSDNDQTHFVDNETTKFSELTVNEIIRKSNTSAEKTLGYSNDITELSDVIEQNSRVIDNNTTHFSGVIKQNMVDDETIYLSEMENISINVSESENQLIQSNQISSTFIESNSVEIRNTENNQIFPNAEKSTKKNSRKQQKSPKNVLDDFRGVKKLISTPKIQKSPKNILEDFRGVRRLLRTPKEKDSPKNELVDLRGVRKLLSTPKEKNSPRNELEDLKGVRQLLSTPKERSSPKNELVDLRGVRKLLSTPNENQSPRNELEDLKGVRQLLSTPKEKNSPKNELEDLRGVRKLLATPKEKRSPKNELEDLRGVRKLLGTPKVNKTPKNELNVRNNLPTPFTGVRRMLRTPKVNSSPKNRLEDLRGVNKLLKTPREKRTKHELEDFSGVKELFNSSQEGNSKTELENRRDGSSDDESLDKIFINVSTVVERNNFDIVFNKTPIRTYSRASSKSPKKVNSEKSKVQERVEKWLENTTPGSSTSLRRLRSKALRSNSDLPKDEMDNNLYKRNKGKRSKKETEIEDQVPVLSQNNKTKSNTQETLLDYLNFDNQELKRKFQSKGGIDNEDIDRVNEEPKTVNKDFKEKPIIQKRSVRRREVEENVTPSPDKNNVLEEPNKEIETKLIITQKRQLRSKKAILMEEQEVDLNKDVNNQPMEEPKIVIQKRKPRLRREMEIKEQETISSPNQNDYFKKSAEDNEEQTIQERRVRKEKTTLEEENTVSSTNEDKNLIETIEEEKIITRKVRSRREIVTEGQKSVSSRNKNKELKKLNENLEEENTVKKRKVPLRREIKEQEAVSSSNKIEEIEEITFNIQKKNTRSRRGAVLEKENISPINKVKKIEEKSTNKLVNRKRNLRSRKEAETEEQVAILISNKKNDSDEVSVDCVIDNNLKNDKLVDKVEEKNAIQKKKGRPRKEKEIEEPIVTTTQQLSDKTEKEKIMVQRKTRSTKSTTKKNAANHTKLDQNESPENSKNNFRKKLNVAVDTLDTDKIVTVRIEKLSPEILEKVSAVNTVRKTRQQNLRDAVEPIENILDNHNEPTKDKKSRRKVHFDGIVEMNNTVDKISSPKKKEQKENINKLIQKRTRKNTDNIEKAIEDEQQTPKTILQESNGILSPVLKRSLRTKVKDAEIDIPTKRFRQIRSVAEEKSTAVVETGFAPTPKVRITRSRKLLNQ